MPRLSGGEGFLLVSLQSISCVVQAIRGIRSRFLPWERRDEKVPNPKASKGNDDLFLIRDPASESGKHAKEWRRRHGDDDGRPKTLRASPTTK